MPNRPMIAAHRGTTCHAPENTLAAIRWAVDAGADLVETDVRITADGQLVLIHDERVERTTDGSGRVQDLTLAELRTLDAGAGERIPTLGEALALLADRPQRLLLDVKSSGRELAARLVETLTKHHFAPRVLVGVRSVELLRLLRERCPELQLLAMAPQPTDIDDFLAEQPAGVRLWARWAEADPELARNARARGAAVWIMSGDRQPSHLQALLAQADGFITDLPVELRRFAEQKG